MPLYKYFGEENFARAFMRKGLMRFGSLSHYRGLEDGGVRGDPKDGTLHYAPADGIEITMVADGRKLAGTSFSTAAQAMFVFCASNELSTELARDFGTFCVEVSNSSEITKRLKARACHTSKLDYAHVFCGPVEYRAVDKTPGVDWAFPEKVALIKPPEYAVQNEFRFALPIKPGAISSDTNILIEIGCIEAITKLHVF